MIWHFFEVWLLFMVVFAVGCGLGAALYAGLARGPLSVAQGALADAVGDVIDEIKWRLGVGPDWRPAFQPSGALPPPRPSRQEEPRLALLPAPAPQEAEESWPSDTAWDSDLEPESAAPDQPYYDEVDGSEAQAVAPAEGTATMRPAGLSAPRAGVPDNLQRIRGIGKRNEEFLHSLGIFHFGQIAAWTPAEVRWVSARLAFPERIERDDWIGQAIVLASGGETEYAKLVAERQRKAEFERGGLSA